MWQRQGMASVLRGVMVVVVVMSGWGCSRSGVMYVDGYYVGERLGDGEKRFVVEVEEGEAGADIGTHMLGRAIVNDANEYAQRDFGRNVPLPFVPMKRFDEFMMVGARPAFYFRALSVGERVALGERVGRVLSGKGFDRVSDVGGADFVVSVTARHDEYGEAASPGYYRYSYEEYTGETRTDWEERRGKDGKKRLTPVETPVTTTKYASRWREGDYASFTGGGVGLRVERLLEGGGRELVWDGAAVYLRETGWAWGERGDELVDVLLGEFPEGSGLGRVRED